MKYPHVIIKGAESVITRIDEHTITKHRPNKGYRVAELNRKFTTHRTRSEAKLLKKLKEANIAVPALYEVDEDSNTLVLEFLDGPQVKEILTNESMNELATKMGELIAKLHNEEVIHADLTTSNLLYVNEQIYLVDLGLSYMSRKVEDKAVDLHLLHQALTSYHAPIAQNVMEVFLETYAKLAKSSEAILERYSIVEKRGRNKN